MKKVRPLLETLLLFFICATVPAIAGHQDRQQPMQIKDVGEIRGIVNYCGSQGAGGILVYIPGRSFVVKTGPDGQFIFHFVPAASYNLAFEIPGQAPYLAGGVNVSQGRVTDVGQIDYCPDADKDGYDASDDCNDGNAAIHPGAAEMCGDGIDNNCNSATDEGCLTCTDDDNDGYFAQQGCAASVDCNDNNANIYPGRSESCGDGIDNNCNGVTDEQCGTVERDADEDGFPESQDCGDNDPRIHPGALELCDDLDNNCDGQVDEDCQPTVSSSPQ